MIDSEARLAKLVRVMWDYYNDGADLQPEDIDDLLTKTGMVITVDATEDDIDEDSEIEIGDPMLQLTPEALQLLEKYKDE